MNAMLGRVLALAMGLGSSPGLPAADWPACGRLDTAPADDWPAPDARGWDVDGIDAARALMPPDVSAVMVVHRGKLVARWGDVATPRLVQSMRKALLGSLVGQEIDAGRLSLETTLAQLAIDDVDPTLTPRERSATLRDLLESRSGIYHSAHYEFGGWKRMRAKLDARRGPDGEGPHAPGQYWIYNNWDFNALGTIVERSAGRSIGQLFATRIAAPLGMQDFSADDVEYTGDGTLSAWALGDHSVHRAYAFLVSSRDLARFGLLWLGCGDWRGTPVVSRRYVLESITGRDTLDGAEDDRWQEGMGSYGFLWFVVRGGSGGQGDLPDGIDYYFGSGAGGHRLFVVPALDLVVSHVVATPGGVGFFSQIRRRLFGSPQVDEAKLDAMLAELVEAMPEPARD